MTDRTEALCAAVRSLSARSDLRVEVGVTLDDGRAVDLEYRGDHWLAYHDHDPEDPYAHVSEATATTPGEAVDKCIAAADEWDRDCAIPF